MDNQLNCKKITSFSTLVLNDGLLKINEIKIPKNPFNLSEDKYPEVNDGVAIVTGNNFIFRNQLFKVVGFTDDCSVRVSPILMLVLREEKIIKEDFITIGFGFENMKFEAEKSYPFPIKDRVDNISALGEGIDLKRKELYKEAHLSYNNILENEGASAMLYIAMAKNLACMKKYDEAIYLFQLANNAREILFGENDFNCMKHINKLMRRNLIPENEFLEYMRTISGNPNYKFPNN